MKTILVTGIGGNVGQGVLKNIRRMPDEFKVIGVNVVGVTAGNYLCDAVYEIPFGDAPNYLDKIKEIIQRESVDLILPTTDLEADVLSKSADELQAKVAISAPEVTSFCLDKWKTFQAFHQFGIPFAQSMLPEQYNGEFEKCVVKPRNGRGSRNIHIDPPHPNQFSEAYVVQEYLDGPELTTACYVTKDRKALGMITFQRELDQGNTSQAEVVMQYDDELKRMLDLMIQHYEFRGSFNVQSRLTEAGIIPFEINGRISGTNSIRPHFGFDDVAYTIREWLFDEILKTPVVTRGTALRVYQDIIYPDQRVADIKNRNDNFYLS